MSELQIQQPKTDRKDEEEYGNKAEAVEIDNPEYAEYLSLEEAYQGEKLRKLLRKVDWHVIPQLILLYMLSYIDRSNVGNARLFGAEADMGLSANDWNIGLTVFFVTYALAGPPSNIILKRFGPKLVLPALLLCVSFVLIGSGTANNRAQWFTLRLLLGLFEAGVFPGCAYTLTTWYTPAQIHGRTTIFYIGASAAGAFGGLLAFGIGQLDHTWGYRGWRWIYVVEGLFSTIMSVIAFFWIQDRPSRQKGWLSPEEARYLVLRNQFMYGSDRSGAVDEFNWRDVRSAFKSWHVWIASWSQFCLCIAVYGLSFTLPTIMSNLGFSAANAQALSAPPYIFAGFCTVASGWYSDKYRQRMWSVVIPTCVAFVGLLICVTTVTHPNLIPLSYIGVSLAAGGLYCLSPGYTVWVGLNTGGQTKRATAIALQVVAAQCGGLVGSNIYLTSEKPAYPTGFGVSLAVLGAGSIVTPMIYWWLIGRENHKRDQMTDEEIHAKFSVEQLASMGDLSPYYRYER